jgi:predicted O-methyltransferase YrrM
MLGAIDITGKAFHHTEGDVDTLHQLAEMLPPDPVIVNIGACFGTSTLAMLEARPDAFIFSIDINVCPKEAEHLARAGVDSQRVVRCLGKSQEIGRHWPGHSADLVFVDGGHAYQGVLDDIFAWSKVVKRDGILAFHDYGTESLPGVRQAIDEVFSDVVPLLFVERIKAYRL